MTLLSGRWLVGGQSPRSNQLWWLHVGDLYSWNANRNHGDIFTRDNAESAKYIAEAIFPDWQIWVEFDGYDEP